jgi:hypothetical protein
MMARAPPWRLAEALHWSNFMNKKVTDLMGSDTTQAKSGGIETR